MQGEDILSTSAGFAVLFLLLYVAAIFLNLTVWHSLGFHITFLSVSWNRGKCTREQLCFLSPYLYLSLWRRMCFAHSLILVPCLTTEVLWIWVVVTEEKVCQLAPAYFLSVLSFHIYFALFVIQLHCLPVA